MPNLRNWDDTNLYDPTELYQWFPEQSDPAQKVEAPDTGNVTGGPANTGPVEGYQQKPGYPYDPLPYTGGGSADFGYGDLLGKMNFPGVPQFKAPKFSYGQRFAAPTAENVLADPGYKFRLGQGEQALQQSAAGRGVLRTGGTLKNILEYGQNFASQEYGNVFDRELQKFMTNYGVERDIFDRYYTGSKDEYAPNLLDWQTRASAQQRAAELEFLKQQALELEALRGGAE